MLVCTQKPIFLAWDGQTVHGSFGYTPLPIGPNHISPGQDNTEAFLYQTEGVRR